MTSTDILIFAGIVIAILVYLTVTHRIDFASLHGKLDALLKHPALAPVPPVVAPFVPVAPVVAAVQTPVTVAPLAPAGTPVANNAENPALAGYAASGDVRGGNAGGTVDGAGAPADRTGFDISVPGNVKVNVLEADREYSFTFDLPEAIAAATVDVLRVGESPTSPNVTIQVVAPDGSVVPNSSYSGLMFDVMPTPMAGLAAGRYQYRLTMSKRGPMGVVLYR